LTVFRFSVLQEEDTSENYISKGKNGKKYFYTGTGIGTVIGMANYIIILFYYIIYGVDFVVGKICRAECLTKIFPHNRKRT
jgi:hypothetical protein